MHILLVLSILIFSSFTINSVFADEFGDRFYNKTPSGLGEYIVEESEIPDIAMDDIAQDLQNIMPAAGEENLSPEVTLEETTEK